MHFHTWRAIDGVGSDRPVLSLLADIATVDCPQLVILVVVVSDTTLKSSSLFVHLMVWFV